MENYRKPNWIGIGCVKCGTSWLWRELRSHPEIYTPDRKEIHFFNKEGELPNKLYLKLLNKHAKKNQLIGEFTPDYFHHKPSKERIKEFCPDVKLIVCFRNPFDRAFSNYKHALNAGRLGNMTFMESYDSWRIRFRSVYSTHLLEWYKLFDKSKIHIVWYDDIQKNPKNVLYSVFKFLGVNPNYYNYKYKNTFDFPYHQNEELKKIKPNSKEKEIWLNFYKKYTEELESLCNKNLSSWKR